MGDSSGGNLILSLMNLIAFCKLPTPHAVVSVYPPTDLNPHRFTPSMIHSLQDRLLFFSVMRTCFKAYVPESVDYKEDWLLSPGRAPDQILWQYPHTILICGELDSLKDDIIRLGYRI